tara:strand:+ start:15718 stop:16182 length:465 start_codon:yes stop_codon:yes gene_type:complete
MNTFSKLGLFVSFFILSSCEKTPHLDFSQIKYLDGGELKSVEIGKGKKTVVHFFASWCSDCRREMPDANEVLSKAGENFRIYYLTDDSPERIAQMSKKYKIPFETYQINKSLKNVGVYYIPLTYFIDENGKQIIAQAEQINWHSKEIKLFLEDN